MFLLPLLLAATVTTSQPAAISKCQVTGTVQGSEPAVAPATAPERISLELKINSVEDKCSGDFPKDTTVAFILVKNNIKSGDNLAKGTVLDASVAYVYKNSASIESYKIVTPEKQNPAVTAQASSQKESFFTWLINAIKKLFGAK